MGARLQAQGCDCKEGQLQGCEHRAPHLHWVLSASHRLALLPRGRAPWGLRELSQTRGTHSCPRLAVTAPFLAGEAAEGEEGEALHLTMEDVLQK